MISDELADRCLTQLWDAIMSLAERRKATPIQRLWVVEISPICTLALNGTKQEQKHDGWGIPSFHAAIFYNGWLAALIAPMAGEILGHDLLNNVTTLVEAINAAQ